MFQNMVEHNVSMPLLRSVSLIWSFYY